MKCRKVLEVSNLDDFGEFCSGYRLSRGDIEKIEYHPPQGDGDRHYVDVYFKDGTKQRDFNFNYVKFDKETEISL